MHTRHEIFYVITRIDNIDDDDSNYYKLEQCNNTTKIVKDFLVHTNVDKFLWCMSNNKRCVFTSFDKIDYKRNQLRNAIL